MKIKIIDLLNMMANDEKIPKHIRFDNYIWDYLEDDNDYDSSFEDNWLFQDYIPNNYDLLEILNDEIEIIEENKKIEKLGKNFTFEDNTNEMAKSDWQVSIISQKINELIDEVNKLKENK